jgi:hypothetical protein
MPSSAPYFNAHLGPITLRECPSCRTKYRLASFRRWDTNHPDKRTLHDVCNSCAPPLNLSDMTPAQRERALKADYPNARAHIVERMNTAEAKRANTQRRKRLTRTHAHNRRTEWSRAITHRLRKELTWATTHANNPDNTSPEWTRFFTAYAQTIRTMLGKIRLKYNASKARIKPTTEEANPATYTTDNTITTLKHLYAQCPVIRGRKLYRDPWVLDWVKDGGESLPGNQRLKGESK